jgi:hypothetical protein
MSDLDSYEIRSDESRQPQSGPSRPIWPIVVAVVVLLALVGGWYFYRSSTRQEVEPEVEAPAPTATAEPAVEPAGFELPSMAESDEAVRSLLAALSSHPDLAAALVPDNLVRRFTASVVNIAQGESPRSHVSHMAPGESFRTAEDAQGIFIDPRSYRRYDSLAAIFDSLDTAGVAELYRNLEPLLQEAYHDLGYPDGDFDEVLASAVAHLSDVPVVNGNVYLTPTVKGFDLADPSLQSLSQAQKNLLRTGPENTKIIQDKLADIAAELGI